MFRKIHSNRKPGDTLWSSLAEEFSVYLNQFKIRFQSILKAYPKQAFALMVLLIVGSFLFTVIPWKTGSPKAAANHSGIGARPVQNSLSQILSHADALRESIRLKEEITAVLAKDSLNGADSIHLEKAIDRLHQLTLKTNPNGKS